MKKNIFIFITVIILIFTMENVFAKESVNIVVLKATNEMKNGLPVYEEGGDEKSFMNIYNKSFIKKSVELYSQAHKYSELKNEDIYIAFKHNSGCHGSVGFYLRKDGKLYDKNGVDMHYSNLITEYSTAFNEGFAEHFEVISRIYEENQQTKKGIYNDIDIKKNNIDSVLNRGTRDFNLPLRLDYYIEIWGFPKINSKREVFSRVYLRK